MPQRTLSSTHLTPQLTLLLATFKLTHPDDGAAWRAADRLLAQLDRRNVRYLLLDRTLWVASFEADPDVLHRCSAHGCTCRGQHHPWCQHRVLRAVLLAQAALSTGDLPPANADALAEPDDPPDRFPCVVLPKVAWPTGAAEVEAHRVSAAQAWAEINELFGE